MISPYINRFLSADTLISSYANPQSFNRYSYVLGDPLRYTDPTGHKACIETTQNGICVVDPGWHPVGIGAYGVTAKGVDKKTRIAIKKAVEDIAYAFWGVLGFEDYASISSAFKGVFDGSLIFQQSDQSCQQANSADCWGQTVGNTITIYKDANGVNRHSSSFNNFLVHEMAHAFDNAVGLQLSNGYSERIHKIQAEGWTPMPTGNAGFAGSAFPSLWIQGDHSDGYIEEAADMFLGWVYNTWSGDISGTRRANWMTLWMTPLLQNGSAPSYNAQYNCNEDTGQGCY